MSLSHGLAYKRVREDRVVRVNISRLSDPRASAPEPFPPSLRLEKRVLPGRWELVRVF